MRAPVSPRSVTRSLLVAAVLAASACSGAASSSADPWGTWELVSLEAAGQPAQAIADPARFTVELRQDGQLGVRADCNRCGGRATVGPGATLAVGPLACTRAYCQTAPLDSTYTLLLQQSTTWRLDGNHQLVLASPAGVLRFQRAA